MKARVVRGCEKQSVCSNGLFDLEGLGEARFICTAALQHQLGSYSLSMYITYAQWTAECKYEYKHESENF